MCLLRVLDNQSPTPLWRLPLDTCLRTLHGHLPLGNSPPVALPWENHSYLISKKYIRQNFIITWFLPAKVEAASLHIKTANFWYIRCVVLNHWTIQNSGDSECAINSIRRSTNHVERSTSMTSVFRSWRLERAYTEGHFWRFLGNLNPKMLLVRKKRTTDRQITNRLNVDAILIKWVAGDAGYGPVACSQVAFHMQPIIAPAGTRSFGIGLPLAGIHVFRQALPYGRFVQLLGYVFVSKT